MAGLSVYEWASRAAPAGHHGCLAGIFFIGAFRVHAYQRRLGTAFLFTNSNQRALWRSFSAMKRLYVVMALGFAASIMVSL
jgi:hypothetical protein